MKFSEKEHSGQPNPLEDETLDNLTNQDSAFYSPPLLMSNDINKGGVRGGHLFLSMV
jgi:hypothetical protein